MVKDNPFARFRADRLATPNYSSADESSMGSFITDNESMISALESSSSDDGQEGVKTRSMASKKNRKTRRQRRKERASSPETTAIKKKKSRPSRVELLTSQECGYETPPMTSRAAAALERKRSASNRRRSSRIAHCSDSDKEISPTIRSKLSSVIVFSSDSDNSDEQKPHSKNDRRNGLQQKARRASSEETCAANGNSVTSRKDRKRRSSNRRSSTRKVRSSCESEDDDEISPSKKSKRSPVIQSDDSDSDEQNCHRQKSNSHTSDEDEKSGSDGDSNEDKKSSSSNSNDRLNPDYPLCAICEKRYTFSKEHGAASLKCGHFFGKPCIKKWLSAQRSCPTCRGEATIEDLRDHRGDTIKQSAREECLALEYLNRKQAQTIRRQERDMKKLIDDNEKYEAENKDLKRKQERSAAEIVRLKRELNDVHQITSNQLRRNAEITGKILFRPIGKHHFVPGFDARARAFDFDGDTFAVGYRTRADVFAIQTAAWRDEKYVPENKSEPFHEEQPRFVIFSPHDPTVVLSGGEDKKAIVHKSGKTTYKQFDIPHGASAWSGCWLSDEEIAIGCRDGRVYKFHLGETHSNIPFDLTEGFKHNPVIFLEFDTRTGALLVGTIKEVYAIMGSSILSLISCEGLDKIRSISYNSNVKGSSMMAVSFRRKEGTTHKLFELTSTKGKSGIMGIDAVEVSEWQTKCTDNTTLWNNCLLAFEDAVALVAFNEDERRLVVHDFSGIRDDVYVSFDTEDLGNPSMMKVLESDETTQIVSVLSSRGITNFSVELG